MCPFDALTGKPTAMAVPLNPFDHSDAGRSTFTFACTASGVASKCARNWGYKPWKTVTENVWNGTEFAPTQIPLAPFYDSCLIAARADYCQDDHSYTKNGTLVDLFDTLDGFTSINATSGLPYAPYQTGPMLHEEYQISALNVFPPPLPTPPPPLLCQSPTPGPHFVSENFSCSELQTMSTDDPGDLALVKGLRRSGMESSRYADLDPGRTCAASNYIDRCDPKEPYGCYRALNLNANAYGAFLAVNSPRHCSHDEDHDGEALDPLCNECVNRVCQIDPSCCGDPGPGFYPGSLVWDQRCTDIRQSVCKSDPASTTLWPPGVTAPPASSHVVSFLRGAIGAFEGFVTDTSGTTFAEGWACDPDHPDASIPVQISVGGPLGTGATLKTGTAFEVLAPSWKETVATECGGGARHGFRVAMPTVSTATDVYVYGIDIDVPGAPFSLLRGGKKTLDATPSAPRAAIWTGWIEPNASGSYTFCKQLPNSTPAACTPNDAVNPANTDLYRLWVNGLYVAGNWKDPDPTVPGAFTLDPPSGSPMQYLLAGVRYGVRVEYRADAASGSQFALLWESPDASFPALLAPAAVPTSALYPMAQSVGPGLRGTYYSGLGTIGNPSFQAPQQTLGAVDYLWTGKNQPIVGPGLPGQPPPAPLPGFAVSDTFSAVFEGQVVPPISGDYTFTADTDGSVRIFVDGQLATDAGGGPPIPDPDTCTHDICRPGAAVSRTCRQGGFCAAQICVNDPYCCAVTWDSNCERKVAEVCHLDCSPTPPTPISLRAGEKAQIRVEYRHIGSTPTTTVRGAHLRLEWALPDTVKDTISVDRLSAGVADGAAPAKGVGLNAAYFSDATFQTEYLDRVEGSLAFDATAWPGPPRSSMICLASSCGAGGPPGAPALVSASSTGASGSDVTVAIVGRGADDGATVEIARGSIDSTGAFVESASIASFMVPAGASATTGGLFTQTVTLGKGTYTLAARQTVGGQTSDWSATLALDAENPAAPPAPTTDAPSGGYVTGNNTIVVGGTAAPGATVTVKIGSNTVGTFTAGADGHWGGSLSLPGPGGYALTITQTVGGVESTSSASATARSALPMLVVTSPAEGACISATPGSTCATSLQVQGSGAVATLGDIQVGDGDGRYFAPHATIPLASGGTFSGPGGALDYGRHMIKIFQQTATGDDVGVVRTVLVRPPAVTISSPAAGAIVDSALTVTGQGLARTGLPGSVIVYQGDIKLGVAPVAADGSFQVAVQVAGSGPETLVVKQAASSLSGAGAAEGEGVTVAVIVKPPAPRITSPATGSAVPGPDVAVAGTAISGATVTVFLDGTAVPSVLADVDGLFTTTVTPGSGTHRLSAQQTFAGATGVTSVDVLIAVGDVTPPTVLITDTGGAPMRELLITTDDTRGADVDFSARVSAQDCVGIGSCTSLTPTCLPPSGSHFELGTTAVTCSATDAAGNTGSSTFVVTVQPPTTAGPVIDATDITAEAQGPDGAPVAYQVTATGYSADCAPPGSSAPVQCTSWHAAYAGLGFAPDTVAIDLNDPTAAPDGKHHGALYAGFADRDDGHVQLLKSTDGGGNWQKLTFPSDVWISTSLSQIVVAGSPASLYVPGTMRGPFPPGGDSPVFPAGLQVSRDGGQTWTAILEDSTVSTITTDPTDPAHMFAQASQTTGTTTTFSIYETHDGWATWALLSTAGLPAQRVQGLAVDPVQPDRLYAVAGPESGDVIKIQIYLKVGGARWQRLDIPPYPEVLTENPATLAIAPTLEPDQTFPTVFAGPLYSRNGGETWKPHSLGWVGAVVFDRQTPGALWAAAGATLSRSPGFDASQDTYPFTGTSFFLQPVERSIVQDLADPNTLYSVLSQFGLYRTTDGGALWTPVLAPGISLPALAISDLAFDPVDPNVAYLLASEGPGGVFRTDDGAASWQARNAGLADPFIPTTAWQIAVDNFNRNNVYVGGVAGLWKSPDGPGTPTNRDAHWTQLSDAWFMGLNPLKPDTALVSSTPFVTQSNCDADCPQPDYFNFLTLHNGGFTQETLWFEGGIYASDPNPVDALHLQFLPGAEQPLLVKISSSGNAHSVLFARQQPSDLGVDTSIGTSFMFADASSGANYLYAGGDGSLPYPNDALNANIVGGGPVLYRASLASVRAHPANPAAADWQPLNTPAPLNFPDGTTAPFTTFTRLVVDPASGGQVMYTIGEGNTTSGNDDTLWESRDGGRTWRRDGAVNASNVWLSPVDGALYARVPVGPASIGPDFAGPPGMPGVLWKRTPATSTPAGARIVRGDLRPSCAGAGGTRAVTTGSTFPIGTTTITCSATDAFGHTSNAPIAITVRDTTPPTVFVPAQATGTTSGGNSIVVNFFVSASDLVDGNITPTCDHNSGDVFPFGTTIVQCTAKDSHNNIGRASFPVIVTQPGSAAPPTLTTPGDVTAEATASNGATVALDVSAATGDATPAPLTPECKAPVGPSGAIVVIDLSGTLFPIGASDVTCTAAAGALKVASAFRVTVKDTTPPELTVPGDISANGEGAWGRRDVSFSVTAHDTVDGDVTPECTPDSPGTFPLGTTQVTCRAADKAGNRATKTFNVTIKGLPPALVLADTTAEATDRLGARVTFDPAPSAKDSGNHPLTPDCVPASGTWFPMGDTPVSCSASDGTLESRGSFVVHVVDHTAPAMVVPPSITVEATGAGGTSVALGVSASDIVDGECAPSNACHVTCRRVTSVGVPVLITSPAQFPIGANNVICDATDAAGNTTSATFTVTVHDTTAPVLTLPSSISTHTDDTGTNTAVVTFTATATDIVGGDIPVACTPKSGTRFLAGTTTVECSARDASGNTASGTFNVVVNSSNRGVACTSDTTCGVGLLCIDGVCCESACGGGVTSDCQACSVAAGGTTNGTCTPVVAGHVCRGSAGQCDIAETCDGASNDCPADAVAPSGTICRNSAGNCDLAETCSGSSVTCPVDAKVAPGTICRRPAGVCDVAEACNGTSNDCPLDRFQPPGTICRAAAGACDVAETCSGASADCPADALAPSGTVCAAGDACHTPAACDGAVATCPAPVPVPHCGDTTPPVFTNVPGTIIAYAPSTAGVIVTYTKPTATDAVDGNRLVDCTPASGTIFLPGQKTVTCTASDTSGNTATATFTVWVEYQTPSDGSFYLQPINPDGSSIFKLGSTIPVKFKLQGASAPITNLVAKLFVAKMSSSVTGTFVEATSNGSGDAGNTFRYDATANQYIFNLSTKSMSVGTWSLRVDLGDLVSHTINVSLR